MARFSVRPPLLSGLDVCPDAGAQAAHAADPSQAFAAPSMMKSPLTVGILFVLVGYYAWYYGWLLWKSKHLTAADLEAAPEATATP